MFDAILLLGPTGSGKTPLGELLERRGLWGRRCVHFDFGAQLRMAAGRDAGTAALTDADIALIRSVLDAGRLLDDHEFPVARDILRQFLDDRGVDGATLVVLNGLPRHAGQAEAMTSLVRVMAVVELSCDAETVVHRICTNAGGDRTGRTDDELDAVRRRVGVYRERTAPLVDYYRTRAVPILAIPVDATTRPEDVASQIERLGEPFRA